MQFLKGLAISLLSLLLFLSLSTFGLIFMLNQTLLNPDFIVAELNTLEISSLTEEILSEQIPQEEKFMAKVLDDTVTDLEPWIREQISTITYASYDYLMGRSQSLNVVVSLQPVTDNLKDNLRQAILQSPPPELTELPPAEVERYFDELYQQFTQDIPSTFEVNQNSLPPESRSTLEQVRQAIGYFQTGYQVLIGFMLLLILGIILINRQVKSTTRSLGTTFLTFGAFQYIGILIAKYFSRASSPDLPLSFQTWLPQFLSDLLAPLEMLSIVLAVTGVVLITVSIIYKRKPSVQIDNYT